MKKRIEYADDETEPVELLLRLRVPSLVIGLIMGFVLSFMTSAFEDVLEKNIALTFFIPFIVYLADAVGTQTQSIYVRALKTGKAKFKTYFLKEIVLGFFIAILFSILTAIVLMIWYDSVGLTLAVSLGIFGAIISAPPVAIVITRVFQFEREDPAVWAGPLATVVQDTLSVIIYGIIATLILL